MGALGRSIPFVLIKVPKTGMLFGISVWEISPAHASCPMAIIAFKFLFRYLSTTLFILDSHKYASLEKSFAARSSTRTI